MSHKSLEITLNAQSEVLTGTKRYYGVSRCIKKRCIERYQEISRDIKRYQKRGVKDMLETRKRPVRDMETR
jgi:hypothetical protein